MADLHAWTDGACSGNPGPGGWGVLMRAHEGGAVVKERALSGGEALTTNNRMELMAAIKALEALSTPCAAVLHTDSQYVQKGFTEWLAGWQRRGWKTAAGESVKNKDLWQRLSAAAAPHTVQWLWVRGHNGHPENERVDELARAAAEQLRPVTRSGGR